MRKTMLAVAILSLSLAGCGGDGNTSAPTPLPTPSPTPTPTNSAPVFSSSAAATVPENRKGVAYQATATDAQNDPLQFAITGGADAALFTITASGALSFKVAPDFENPTDADHNNIYELVLSASDGKLSETLPLRLTVENQRFQVRQLSSSFNDPSRIVPVNDGSGRLYVVERGGLVKIFDPATAAVADNPFLDVRSDVSTDGERGLLNLTVNQERTNIGTLLKVSAYVFMTNHAGDIEIRRYYTPGNGNFERAVPETLFTVYRIPHPGNRSNGGALQVCCIGLLGGPQLRVGFGDAYGDVSASKAQDYSSFLGKVVSVIIRDDTYAPTPINMGSPIIESGLRDPHDFGVDRGIQYQEVNSSGPPPNYGWPAFDGTSPYSGPLASGQRHTLPVLQYNSTTPNVNGGAIVGGPTYNGAIEDLSGLYIFGDAINGGIWTIAPSNFAANPSQFPLATSIAVSRSAQFKPDRGSLIGLTSIAQAADGKLYMSTASGGIYVVEIANP